MDHSNKRLRYLTTALWASCGALVINCGLLVFAERTPIRYGVTLSTAFSTIGFVLAWKQEARDERQRQVSASKHKVTQ